jgi:hypothetical protein
MTLEARFAPSNPDVLSGVIDGDALLINLATGTYYSMVNAAGYTWALIERRLSIGEMIDVLVKRYDVSAERALQDLQTFLSGLEQERLVLATSLASTASGDSPAPTSGHLPYQAPTLERIEQPDWGIQPNY